jgi:O-antigen/teichoic acid export membrane protein
VARGRFAHTIRLLDSRLADIRAAIRADDLDTAVREIRAAQGLLAQLSGQRVEEPGPPPEASPVARTRSFASAASQTFGANLAVALISLANVLVTSRALGPTGRGDIALLTTIAIMTSNLALLGVQEAIVNIASSEPVTRPALASNALALAIVNGLLAATVVGAVIAVAPAVGGSAPRWLIAVVLVTLPMLVAQTYFQLLVQADYGFATTNLVWVLAPIVNLTVNAAFAAAGHLTFATAVLTWLGGQLLGTLVLAVYIRRRGSGFGRPNAALARRAVTFGLKSHLGRVMMLGNYRLDQWILGAVAGSRELGLYSVAVAWAESLFYLPTALVIVQRPDLVRAARRDAASRAAATVRGAFLLTLPVAAGLFLAAPLLCAGVFGSSFSDSATSLRILVVGAFGVIALKQLSNALTAQSLPLSASAGIGVALAATVGLDVLLIPSHGAVGAAIASSIAYTIGGLAIIAIFTAKLGGGLRDFVPRPSDVSQMSSSARVLLTRLRAVSTAAK